MPEISEMSLTVWKAILTFTTLHDFIYDKRNLLLRKEEIVSRFLHENDDESWIGGQIMSRRIKKFCQVTILVLGLWIMGSCTFSVSAATNLLINGSGENAMEGWTDPDQAWEPSTSGTCHDPVHGNTFLWPSKKGIASTQIYQDVDVSKIKSGTYMCLSGYLANFDQSPHDQATLRLDYLDKNGKVLASDQTKQRNPQWSKHTITLSVPSGTVKARIYLIAQRFVGQDNDAYFDDVSFYTIGNNINKVFITGKKSTAKPGEKVQLSASDGYYKKASDYIWFSSYDKIATVDANGLVTFQYVTDNSLIGSEVIIYAKNKKTGITGKYYMNSNEKNEPIKENPTVTPPAEVKNFRAKSLLLSWKAYKSAAGYKLYRYDTKAQKYTVVKKIKGGKKTTYKYPLKPVKNLGNSFILRAYKKNRSKEYKVKNFFIKGMGFQWDKNTKATGYRIYQWDSKSTKYKKIKTISNPNTTSYAVSELKRGIFYKFKICSYKSENGQSVISKFSQEISKS